MFDKNSFFGDEIKILKTLWKKIYKLFSLCDPMMDNRAYKFTFI